MQKETNSWSGMADQVMKTWTDVGTQAWKSWFDMMALAARNPIADTKPGVESINQRFVENQELLLRLLQLSFHTWQDLFPKVESGEDWQHSLKNYTEQLRAQVEDYSQGTLKVNQNAAELWQLYLKETQKFSQLWANALGATVDPLSQATVTGTSQPWIELNNLYWNLLYEQSFGSLMQIPLLGPSREINGKLLRSFNGWTTLYRASVDYQILLAEIQAQSFEELMRELISLAEKGEKVKDWRQFQELWGRIADDVFEKAFCFEDNLKVRGRFLNALNNYRLDQQELMEVWMKMMNLPLRSEVDEVHKSIYELRKEVKNLKKALAKYEAQAQTTPPKDEGQY
ncbi:class III poly(R)-hydroxyalkanoic acid synthase subunit PhaE [Chlorogloeopsis sp. ULAP02]|uniref:class III poly(R)-hydroxyalkanoic acid synthase subunit PhaE n=1 Tax=Chlorogloeopsis sp. ULAP02 TaxID=3107926 RepID=UPI00313531CC